MGFVMSQGVLDCRRFWFPLVRASRWYGGISLWWRSGDGGIWHDGCLLWSIFRASGLLAGGPACLCQPW